MRKYAQYLPGFLAGALIVLVAAWALGFIPTKIPYCHDEQTANKECPINYVALVAIWQIGKILNWISPGVTAVATGALAIITWRLVTLGKDQTKTTRARLRAYVVTVVGQAFRQGGVKGLKFEFRPFVLNTGQTPAYEVRTASRLGFMAYKEALAFDFRLPDLGGGSVMTLGPNQNRFVHTILDRRLSRSELREFKRGQKAIFVYGTTWYRDIFGEDRYTNFCYHVGWWLKRGGPPAWQTVPRHNDSD